MVTLQARKHQILKSCTHQHGVHGVFSKSFFSSDKLPFVTFGSSVAMENVNVLTFHSFGKCGKFGKEFSSIKIHPSVHNSY